jgi:two-component system chemotaxis response regulator CheY
MKILVVDDEADAQQLFIQRFRQEIKSGEFEFSFALSGNEALAYLDKNHAETALILSDINMPGMTGIELLSQIRRSYDKPSPVVMMITAYGDDENRSHAMLRGANDFLTKPVDFTSLKEKLRALVN